MSREAVMTALFALLTQSASFKTTGRRLIWWSQVKEQPALFLRNVSEDILPRHSGMPAKVVMDCEVWLYSNAGKDPNVAPAIGLNTLLDAVTAALKPAPCFETQTLGGLVQHCWIEGKTELHPGDQDGQAIAVIPVKILVPSFGG